MPLLLSYDLKSTGPTLYTDEAGQIHAAWNTFDGKGVGVSGHYARLDIERKQWNDPIEIDEGGIFLGIKYIQVFEHNGGIFLAYYGGRDNANWWRRSQDGGTTWSNPARISPQHVGTNGPVSFVVDSNNVLHLFFGQRINDENHGMWHSIWTGGGWTSRTPVVRGPAIKEEIGGNGFDPRHPRTAIVNGNVLLITWATDGAAGENGAWYSYTILDAPELPVVPLPTLPATPTPTVTPAPTTATPSASSPMSSPTRQIITNYETNDSFAGPSNPTTPIIVSIVPIVLLISVFITIHQLQKHLRR
jgi:hypothetical protein